MLKVTQLHAYYDKSHILQGVNFEVGAGEIVSLLGRNGVGRSTTVKTLMGEVAPQGSILFKGEEIAGLKPFEIAQRGLGCVPENRDIFPTLTVRQNLVLGLKGKHESSRWSIEDMFTLFPNLAARADVAGGVLSGGEQQMLAIGRALMTDPDILILDEPTEGLAPIIIEQIFEKLTELKSRGMTILLVEQNLHFALGLADQVSLMSRGQIVWQGLPEDLKTDQAAQARWLGV